MYTVAMPLKTPQKDPLSAHQDFSHLSLADLLLARDKNHVELMRKKNVIGTAVGLYLIRNKEPWPRGRSEGHKPDPIRSARTLGNSSVRPYSWPCILVFVD